MQWCVQLPAMYITGTSVPFDKYRDRMTGADIDLRPTAQILAELDEIEREMEAQNGS